MPLNGFGVWKAESHKTKQAVLQALKVGYRHIDCAAVYMNETDVGDAFAEWIKHDAAKREQLFITSKVWNTCHARGDVVAACRQTLKDLQIEQLDLYLVHHPFAWTFQGLPITEDTWIGRNEKGEIAYPAGITLEETWRGMEECVKLGLTKDIGVSNYPVALLMDLKQYARILPAVNQCEAHVYFSRKELRSVCESIGMHFTMYSILGSGKQGPLQDDVVNKMAGEKGISAAQILIAWGLHTGSSVLAKSVNPERIQQNFAATEVKLTAKDVEKLDALGREMRTCNMVDYWGFPSHA